MYCRTFSSSLRRLGLCIWPVFWRGYEGPRVVFHGWYEMGAQEHTLRRVLQLGTWYGHCAKIYDNADVEQGLMFNADDGWGRKKTVAFSVEAIPLMYTRAPGSYQQHAAPDANHTSVLGQTIHFLRPLVYRKQCWSSSNIKGVVRYQLHTSDGQISRTISVNGLKRKNSLRRGRWT